LCWRSLGRVVFAPHLGEVYSGRRQLQSDFFHVSAMICDTARLRNHCGWLGELLAYIGPPDLSPPGCVSSVGFGEGLYAARVGAEPAPPGPKVATPARRREANRPRQFISARQRHRERSVETVAGPTLLTALTANGGTNPECSCCENMRHDFHFYDHDRRSRAQKTGRFLGVGSGLRSDPTSARSRSHWALLCPLREGRRRTIRPMRGSRIQDHQPPPALVRAAAARPAPAATSSCAQELQGARA